MSENYWDTIDADSFFKVDSDEEFQITQPEAAAVAEIEGGMNPLKAFFQGSSIGVTDTVRGVTQWAGYQEDEMREQEAHLNSLFDSEDYGNYAKAGYYLGLIADPVGWMLPAAKIRAGARMYQVAKSGAIGGAASGATGYIDESTGMENTVEQRAQNAGLGAVAGAVGGVAITPAVKGLQKAYEPIGELAWKGLREPAVMGAIGGGGIGFTMTGEDGTPLTNEEKIRNTMLGVLAGGAAFKAPKVLHKAGVTEKDWNKQFGEWFVPYYGVDNESVSFLRRATGRTAAYQGDFEETATEIMNLPYRDRQVVYEMMTNPKWMGPNEPKLQKIANKNRAKVTEYMDHLVDLGVLDSNVAARNVDDYLRTTYKKHEVSKNLVEEYNGSMFAFRQRGNVREVDTSDLKLAEPDEFGVQKVLSDHQNLDDAGPWELLKDKGDKSIVRRQWTKDEKLKMGEITDAGYAMHKTGALMARERAMGELMDEMVKTPSILKSKNDIGAKMIPKDKSFGRMQGKYVDENVYREIMNLRKIKSGDHGDLKALFAGYRQVNALWKKAHTVWNPAVQVGNIVSSGAMYDLAGGSAREVANAAILLRQKGPMFKQMMEDGVLSTSFIKELNEGSDIAKLYTSQSAKWYEGLIEGSPKGIRGALELANKVGKGVRKLDKMAEKSYTFGDDIWRAGLYLTEVKKLTPKIGARKARMEAQRKAKEFFVDYDYQPPALQAIRHTMLPFFSYTYGIVPRLAEVGAKNPIKYAKWAYMMYLLNSIGENTSGIDPDRLAEIKALQDDNPMFGLPFMPNASIVMPEFISKYISDSGDVQVLNLERVLPGGVFGEKQGLAGIGQIPGLPNAAQPSFGVAGAIYNPSQGVDPFTGREIPEGQRMDAALRNAAPNWGDYGLPYGLGSLMEDVTGIESYQRQKEKRAEGLEDFGGFTESKDDYSPLTANLSGFGVRIQPKDESKLEWRFTQQFEKRIDNLNKRIGDIEREPKYSDEERDQLIEELELRIEAIEDMRDDALDEAYGG